MKLKKITLSMTLEDGHESTVTLDDLDPDFSIEFNKGCREKREQRDPMVRDMEHDGRGSISLRVSGRWNPT